MILEDDRTILSCMDAPSHYSLLLDKFNYTILYKDLFGGVVALKEEQYTKINGFSNKFLGWGGEDDDFRERVRVFGKYKITRPYSSYAKYKMIKHKSGKVEQIYEKNRKRYKQRTFRHADEDGLNVSINFFYFL